MNKNEVKEQMQEDILCLLEGFEIESIMDPQDYEALKNNLCQIVIDNLNNLV